MKQEIIEEWKDIKGYEGLYQVSNLGRVKSLPKYAGSSYRKTKILKNNTDTYGYSYVILCKNNKNKMLLIHRLVASEFIPNLKDKPQVNHKDGNKKNNKINNLEWCTDRENKQHGFKNNLYKPHNGKIISKRIDQYSIYGEYLKTWEKASVIQDELHFLVGRIHNCCKGIHKTAYGYIWRYNEAYN